MAGPDLPSIITSAVTPLGLQARNDPREPGWMFWELRTLNMHRVVGLLQKYRQFADAHDFESTIRRAAARNFKCSWWRGLGFGTVAQVAAIPLSIDDLSPVYRSTLQGLAEAGYRISSVTRDKDGLLKLLTGVADVEVALLSLGTRNQAFPEFRDALRRDPRQA